DRLGSWGGHEPVRTDARGATLARRRGGRPRGRTRPYPSAGRRGGGARGAGGGALGALRGAVARDARRPPGRGAGDRGRRLELLPRPGAVGVRPRRRLVLADPGGGGGGARLALGAQLLRGRGAAAAGRVVRERAAHAGGPCARADRGR